MEPEIIRLEAVSLRKQKVLYSRLHQLELGERLVKLSMIFRAEEPQRGEHGELTDPALPWIEVDNDAVVIWWRERIRSLKKIWIQDIKRWQIIGCFDGTMEDMYLFFKKQADCEAVFNKLLHYFFTDKPI